MRSLADNNSRRPDRGIWRRLLHCVALVLLGFPLTSYGVYQLFLFLYSPPPPSAQTALIESRHCPGDINNNMVNDDACRTCNSDELTTVYLCVQTDSSEFIGHAFIKTTSFATGFRTHEGDIGLVDYLWPLAATHPGYIRNDDESPFDYFLPFQLCPQTRDLLLSSIYEHAVMPYQVGNWSNGRNCATWATDRLIEAGLPAPLGDCPNRLAHSMRATHKSPNLAASIREAIDG